LICINPKKKKERKKNTEGEEKKQKRKRWKTINEKVRTREDIKERKQEKGK